MTRRYGTLGPLLRKVGYDVIPVKAGAKAPAIPSWQHGLTLEETLKCAANGHADNNVGLLASRYPGVDLDVTNQECADAVAANAQAVLGPAPVRFGGVSPKRLLMYTTTKPFAKVKVFLSGPGQHPAGNADGAAVCQNGKDYRLMANQANTNTLFAYLHKKISSLANVVAINTKTFCNSSWEFHTPPPPP